MNRDDLEIPFEQGNQLSDLKLTSQYAVQNKFNNF